MGAESMSVTYILTYRLTGLILEVLADLKILEGK